MGEVRANGSLLSYLPSEEKLGSGLRGQKSLLAVMVYKYIYIFVYKNIYMYFY